MKNGSFPTGVTCRWNFHAIETQTEKEMNHWCCPFLKVIVRVLKASALEREKERALGNRLVVSCQAKRAKKKKNKS